MTRVSVTVIIGTEQVRGSIETNSWPLAGSRPDILVQLDNGQQQMVPITALNRQEDGSDMAPMPADEDTSQPETNKGEQGQSVVVPVMAEDIAIYERELERGRVRLTKTVHECEKRSDEPLFRENVLIERIASNCIVEALIPLRYEGDTMIISLVEEVPVIEKRLLLKEE